MLTNSTPTNPLETIALEQCGPHIRAIEHRYNQSILALQELIQAINPEAAGLIGAMDIQLAAEKHEIVLACFSVGFLAGLDLAQQSYRPTKNIA